MGMAAVSVAVMKSTDYPPGDGEAPAHHIWHWGLSLYSKSIQPSELAKWILNPHYTYGTCQISKQDGWIIVKMTGRELQSITPEELFDIWLSGVSFQSWLHKVPGSDLSSEAEWRGEPPTENSPSESQQISADLADSLDKLNDDLCREITLKTYARDEFQKFIEDQQSKIFYNEAAISQLHCIPQKDIWNKMKEIALDCEILSGHWTIYVGHGRFLTLAERECQTDGGDVKETHKKHRDNFINSTWRKIVENFLNGGFLDSDEIVEVNRKTSGDGVSISVTNRTCLAIREEYSDSHIPIEDLEVFSVEKQIRMCGIRNENIKYKPGIYSVCGIYHTSGLSLRPTLYASFGNQFKNSDYKISYIITDYTEGYQAQPSFGENTPGQMRAWRNEYTPEEVRVLQGGRQFTRARR